MFNNKMREIRLTQGITLKQLSEKTKISAGYLSHLERGKRINPSIQIMDKIAYALNKTILEVFFDN